MVQTRNSASTSSHPSPINTPSHALPTCAAARLLRSCLLPWGGSVAWERLIEGVVIQLAVKGPAVKVCTLATVQERVFRVLLLPLPHHFYEARPCTLLQGIRVHVL